MAHSNFVQSDFRWGEWGPYSQGQIEDPNYKKAMNVCRNGFPIEEGGWVRRSGSRFCGTTRNGTTGRLIKFDFEQLAPYQMELTDTALRFWSSAVQSSILTNTLPYDMVLATTNDDRSVTDISTADPAVVTLDADHDWATGDHALFLFDYSLSPSFCPLLQHRVFEITVTATDKFSLIDPLTGDTIDGSTLGWAATSANTVAVVRINTMTTPYAAADLALLRRVQAEDDCIFLHESYQPEVLVISALPTATSFATFTLAAKTFTDGPYLDAPTDGSVLTPTIAPVSGVMPVSGQWSAVCWSADLSLYCAVCYGTAIAATSADGITWVQRALPVSANWTAVVWKNTVTKLFCAVATSETTGVTTAATSADGITWTLRTLSIAGYWRSIAWNGTSFCAVGGAEVVPTASATTSTDGTTWATRTLPTSQYWSSIAWDGTKFCAIGSLSRYATGNAAATSADGTTWASTTMPSSSLWKAIASDGTIFCAIAYGSNAAATSVDHGATWTARTLPSTKFWSEIAWNAGEALFMVTTSNGSGVYATSPDGITWTEHNTPNSLNIGGLASNGTNFVAVGTGSNKSLVDTSGVFGILTCTASAIASINEGTGFAATDVGRAIRLFSEPLPYFSGTTYAAGASVTFSGAYYTSLAGSNTGNQPDISPTKWAINTSAAAWTWGTISSVNSASSVNIVLNGIDLLYTVQINTWRLGLYSDTTGWPTCGAYFEGRLWLAGATPNRVDASMSNELYNFSPTAEDGQVADNHAISAVFNSTEVNPIFWMIDTQTGIICGTQGGEWEIRATANSLPLTPTTTQAHKVTKYGCANVEPEHTELTISFVQRFQRKILEFFPDVFSGKYTAPNLTKNAKHLTNSEIQEIKYQQELAPILWARLGDGSLIGATYKRSSLFSTQGPEFCGWHRHDFGSNRTVESISTGPSVDDNLDSLSMVTLGADGLFHVELIEDMFDVNADIKSGWFLDNSIVPSGGVITGTMATGATITFHGLWHLNGQSVTVWCGGIDCGDATVADGSITVPIDVSATALFTSTYLNSISSLTEYGEMTCPVLQGNNTYFVPACVGFTYTSQGQLLRPDTPEQTRSSIGPGSAKPSRIYQFGAMFAGTQGVKMGTDFTTLYTANFRSKSQKAYTALQLFTGVYWDSLNDTYSFDSMIAWQIDRPYPCAVQYMAGFMDNQER